MDPIEVLSAGCKAASALELLKTKLGDVKKAEKAWTQVRKEGGGKDSALAIYGLVPQPDAEAAHDTVEKPIPMADKS